MAYSRRVYRSMMKATMAFNFAKAFYLLLSLGQISAYVTPLHRFRVKSPSLSIAKNSLPESFTRLTNKKSRPSALLAKAEDDREQNGIFFSNQTFNQLSARKARIQGPFTLVLGSTQLILNSAVPDPAYAAVQSKAFDDALKQFFPGTIPNPAVISRIASALRQREYRPTNTLIGASLCPDEINDTPASLAGYLQKQFASTKDGGIFNLGGLGGLPFGGKSGFGAFFSHIPDQGKVIILFGPHVGISNDGIVGKVERIGKGKVSTSCGAAIGAYMAMMSEEVGQTEILNSGTYDLQEEYIIENLKVRLNNIEGIEQMSGAETISLVTNEMYDLILDMMTSQVEAYSSKPAFWDSVSEVTLLGGILVNRGHGKGMTGGQDFFQPLTLKVLNAEGEVSLYGEVFGDLPIKERVLPMRSPAFDFSLQKYFPGSIPNSAVLLRLVEALQKRNFLSSNTLLGTSLCSDEINHTPLSLERDLRMKFTDYNSGGVFDLGGLGGLPFVGTSGFGAFFSHCPDNGKIIILFGPHVGIANDGKVGKVERIGKEKPSTSCGAAVGAYKAILAGDDENNEKKPAPTTLSEERMDYEEQFIIKKLKGRLTDLASKEVQGDDATISYVTEQMFELIFELVRKYVFAASAKPGFWDSISEIALVGGIVINRGQGKGLKGGEDFFQPLLIETVSAEGETDLYGEVFGDLPTPKKQLTPVDSFENSIQMYFPGSFIDTAVLLRVKSTLRSRGYMKDNTLLGSSLCPDEINDTPASLMGDLQQQFTMEDDGGVFDLGGLGGLPFVGTSGFGAFFSHCPDSGKVLIVFGPHVGISDNGVVGKVERIGKENVSTSCGAAVGAYKAILAGKTDAPVRKSNSKTYDLQEEYIIDRLKNQLGDLAEIEKKGGDGTIAYVTNEMYDLILNMITKYVDESTAKSGFWDKISEVTLLGGIVVNRGHGNNLKGGQDFFQPLTMTAISAEGETDLFEETFGETQAQKRILRDGKPNPYIKEEVLITEEDSATLSSPESSDENLPPLEPETTNTLPLLDEVPNTMPLSPEEAIGGATAVPALTWWKTTLEEQPQLAAAFGVSTLAAFASANRGESEESQTKPQVSDPSSSEPLKKDTAVSISSASEPAKPQINPMSGSYLDSLSQIHLPSSSSQTQEQARPSVDRGSSHLNTLKQSTATTPVTQLQDPVTAARGTSYLDSLQTSTPPVATASSASNIDASKASATAAPVPQTSITGAAASSGSYLDALGSSSSTPITTASTEQPLPHASDTTIQPPIVASATSGGSYLDSLQKPSATGTSTHSDPSNLHNQGTPQMPVELKNSLDSIERETLKDYLFIRNVVRAVKIAKNYGQRDLQTKMENLLKNSVQIDPSLACAAFDEAVSKSLDDEIVGFCIQMIRSMPIETLLPPSDKLGNGVQDLGISTIEYVVSDSEIEAFEVTIFQALLKWIEGGDMSEDRRSRGSEIAKNIRLSRISARDLQNIVTPSGLVPFESISLAYESQATVSKLSEKIFSDVMSMTRLKFPYDLYIDIIGTGIVEADGRYFVSNPDKFMPVYQKQGFWRGAGQTFYLKRNSDMKWLIDIEQTGQEIAFLDQTGN